MFLIFDSLLSSQKLSKQKQIKLNGETLVRKAHRSMI